jgi:hypothetical protein
VALRMKDRRWWPCGFLGGGGGGGGDPVGVQGWRPGLLLPGAGCLGDWSEAGHPNVGSLSQIGNVANTTCGVEEAMMAASSLFIMY